MANRIHIVQIGDPEPGILDAVGDAVRDLSATVPAIRPDIVRAPHRIDPAPYYDSARKQYSSRAMLQTLLDLIPEPDQVLGVTDVDLYQPILTFVFGEAQLRGRAALISTARLSQTWYGVPESYPLLYERSIKEALHELGHTWGLVHCLDYRCVMTASRVVEEIDTKEAAFCRTCAAELGR